MSQKTLNSFFQTRKKESTVVNRKKANLVPPSGDVKKVIEVCEVAKPSLAIGTSSPRKRTLEPEEKVVLPCAKPIEETKKDDVKIALFQSIQQEDEVGASPKKNRCNEVKAAAIADPFVQPKILSPKVSSVSTKTKLESPKPQSPKTLKTPEKASPADVKKALGSTNSLATLQARLKSLPGSPKTPKARKALFIEDNEKASRSTPASPQLSKRSLNFEVSVVKPKAIPVSPVKASPRKQALEIADSVPDKAKDLLQPSEILPLPSTYKELAGMFETLDGLIARYFNRGQAITITDIKKQAGMALRKSLTDTHLQQIRCVYPKAYDFHWEPKKDANGKLTQDFELNLTPHLNRSSNQKLLPHTLVQRVKFFNHSLLTIVQDHHQEFLKSLDLDGLDNDKIHRWHKDFDVEQHCPDLDTMEFPSKPYVESPERNPQAMLAKITGLNASVEKSLKKVIDITTPTKAAPMTPVSKAIEDDIQINEKLRGLSPQVIAKIKAKERERRIKEMTTNKAQQKEIELLETLLHNRVRSHHDFRISSEDLRYIFNSFSSFRQS